ncbi:MAG: hypothetical protein Q9219_004790 [cf. Caloplaca sp. 3 TL-2023]
MDAGFTASRGIGGTDSYTYEVRSTRKANCSEILVAGELKNNPGQDRYAKAWVELATYAREVLRTQDRRSMLGLALYGSRVRLRQLDRSVACVLEERRLVEITREGQVQRLILTELIKSKRRSLLEA